MFAWLTKPDTIYASVLFVLSVVVSLFAGEIRRFFKNYPLKVNEKAIATSQYELALLERLHENPYRLLLWALWNLVTVLRYSLFLVILIAGINIADHLIDGLPLTAYPIPLTTILAGGFAGRSFVMWDVISSLYDYDNKTAKLKSTIEKARKALEGSSLLSK